MAQTLFSAALLLPETGQLWWPVPVLAGIGLLVFAAGWLLGRKHDEEK